MFFSGMGVARLARIIHVYLLLHGEASAHDIYEHINRKYEYYSIVRYFNLLKKIGLVEVSRVVENEKDGPIKKTYYRIVSGRENDPCWNSPWKCYGKMYGYTKYVGLTDTLLGPKGEIKVGRLKKVICGIASEYETDVIPIDVLASYFRVDDETMEALVSDLLGLQVVYTDTGRKAVEVGGVCRVEESNEGTAESA